MTSSYTREQLKLSVAKMCLTIGWHTTMTTPIELLTDILCNYLCQLGKLTNDYANGFGLSEASVEHLVLAFKEFHLNLHDLGEFVKNVDCPEPPIAVPRYPIPKEDHLNFLKPGSKEVVSRQVHVHEHLPPMFPELEEENITAEPIITETAEQSETSENVFKRPAEVSQDVFKRPRILSDGALSRPPREISSVMMTSSGFLSPSREGRLPEARAPVIALEPSIPMPTPEQSDHTKKTIKGVKKSSSTKNINNNNINDEEIFKPYKDCVPHKHSSNLKHTVHNKMKHRVRFNISAPAVPTKNYMVVTDSKTDIVPHKKHISENDNQLKFNKALAAARMKTEKFNTTITPIPPKSIPATIVRPEALVDKLFTEPDKKKVNILRKISVKTDRAHKIKEDLKIESRESSPDLIIDESFPTAAAHHSLPKDITIELVNPTPLATVPFKKSPEKADRFEKYYFDDYSPPGTPSTPRTPEMVSNSPPLNKGEKRKPKSKHRKLHKYSSPSGLDIDVGDVELERPKTPDSNIVVKQEKRRHTTVPPMHFPFFSPFSGPGLIPAPFTNSLFPHIPMPPLGLPNFGQPPYIPSIHTPISMNLIPSSHTHTLPASSIPVPVTTTVPPVASVPARVLTPPVVTSTVVKEEEHNAQPGSTMALDGYIPPLIRLPDNDTPSSNTERKNKEHKKDKKDKLKKKNKKDKHKSEKRKLKEEKKEKLRTKKEKKEKKKHRELQNGSASPLPKLTLKLPPKPKLKIKAIVKQDETIVEPQSSTLKATDCTIKREMSPELARFSALVTGQPKPKNNSLTPTSIDNFPTSSPDSINVKKFVTPKVRTREIPVISSFAVEPSTSCFTDSEGTTIWICPGCGIQDDGSPMIGCDDCDAWYHWVCVGIQVPPDRNEDWYCRHCIDKNRDLLKREKRKKRKDKKGQKH